MSRETRRSYTSVGRVVRVAVVVRSSGSVGTPLHCCEAMAKWLRGAAQVAVAVAKWLKRIWRNVEWGPTAPWPGCVGPMSWSRVGPHAAALAWSMTNVFDVTPGEVSLGQVKGLGAVDHRRPAILGELAPVLR